MKKLITILIIIFFLILTGCKKCIKQEQYYDSVIAVDAIYTPQNYIPLYTGKVMAPIIIPESYEAIIEYKNDQYNLFDYKSYKLCEKNKGKNIQAEIKKRIYNDGSIKYYIVKLEGKSKKIS